MHTSLEDLIAASVQRDEDVSRDDVLRVSIDSIRKRNWYSSFRMAGAIEVEFLKAGCSQRRNLWAKWVEQPRRSFESMQAMYEATGRSGYNDPIPRPVCYDEHNSLLVMEAVEGTGLLGMTLKDSILKPDSASSDLPSLFARIGGWLSEYHSSAATGAFGSLQPIIDKVSAALTDDTTFNGREKSRLNRVLEEIAAGPASQRAVPYVRPHNDFTLRNLVVSDEQRFFVVDWDAMVHPQFTQEALCWWDVTTFVLNLQSLLKIEPLIRSSTITRFCSAFVEGYLNGNESIRLTSADEYMRDVLYVLTLKYWLGLDSDRPMSAIYRNKLGWRYSARLKRSLLSGTADIARASSNWKL